MQKRRRKKRVPKLHKELRKQEEANRDGEGKGEKNKKRKRSRSGGTRVSSDSILCSTEKFRGTRVYCGPRLEVARARRYH